MWIRIWTLKLVTGTRYMGAVESYSGIKWCILVASQIANKYVQVYSLEYWSNTVFEGIQNHVKELLRNGILINVTWFKKTNSLIIIATVNNQIAVSISLKFVLSYWNLRAVKWQSNRIYLSTRSIQHAIHFGKIPSDKRLQRLQREF